jgi:diacylglycerol O-acyltransferase / trehalose O-mycolyltransferase
VSFVHPSVLARHRLDARTVDLTVASPALGRTAQVRLLLPVSFAEDGDSWPVLYLLHGCCDTYDSWTRSTDVAGLTAGSPVIVAMPEGGRAGFYANWWNAGRYGAPAWETFHLDELPAILAREYRAGGRRVVAGLSMGGFGAISYAARRPGMFAAAASYSGPLHTTYPAPGFGGPDGIAEVLTREGEDPLALWGPPGERPEVWAAHNPYDLADRLRGIPLYVSCGDGHPGRFDEPDGGMDYQEVFLCAESRAFVERATELGLAVTAEVADGGTHTWPYWQEGLYRSYPMLMRALQR